MRKEPVLPVVVLMTMVGGSSGLTYPLFYMTPPTAPPELEERFAFVPTPLAEGAPPLITNRLEISLDPAREGEHYQVSQFHSQDAKGRVFFGFRSPDQVRLEARNGDGTIKGSYSYVDPFGQLIKIQYWDDGHGFQTSGNNLPEMYYGPPQYTPEVQAARNEHFRLYKQALEAALASGNGSGEDEEKVEYPDGDDSSLDKESDEETDEDGDDVLPPGVEDEEDEIIDLENYPKVKYPPGIITPNYAFDEETDGVTIENPEMSFKNAVFTRFWQRNGKSMRASKPVHEAVDEGSTQTQVRLVPSLTVTKTGNTRSAVTSLNKKGDNIDGFYYHFQHYIPVQVLAHDDMTEGESNVERQSVSALAKETGAVPVAAVHDVQMSPFQRGVFPQQLIYLSPVPPFTPVPPVLLEKHDAQVSPLQRIVSPDPHYVPQLAKPGTSAPIGETHDAQVSPLQRIISPAQHFPLHNVPQLAKAGSSVPIRETHDAQVSPLQRIVVPDQHFPLHNVPQLAKPDTSVHIAENHDAQVSPIQSGVHHAPQAVQKTLSSLLEEAGPNPSVEIHDTQISPKQSLPEKETEQSAPTDKESETPVVES